MAIRIVGIPKKGVRKDGVRANVTLPGGCCVVGSAGYLDTGAPVVDTFIGINRKAVTGGTGDGDVEAEFFPYSPEDLYEIDTVITPVTRDCLYSLYAITAAGTINVAFTSTVAGTYCFFVEELVSATKVRGHIRLNA